MPWQASVSHFQLDPFLHTCDHISRPPFMLAWANRREENTKEGWVSKKEDSQK